MINWLSSKLKQEGKTNHPLGNDDALRKVISELHRGRSEANLHELADWLLDPELLSEEMPPGRALRAIQALDEAAQPDLYAVWNAFLVDNRIDNLGEQKLRSLDHYYRAAITSNLHAAKLIGLFPAAAGNNASTLLGCVLSRALRAQAAQARILHIRYRSPDAVWWSRSGELIVLATKTGTLNQVQPAYPAEIPSSSPWLEHLLALFFEVSPLGNLNPRQMDLLARVLRKLEPHFMVRDSFSRNAPFHCRIDEAGLPKKLVDGLPPDPNNVYFGPGLAFGHLVRLRGQLGPAVRLPEWMAESQCPIESAIGVLDALVLHWSDRPPQRVSSRQKRVVSIRTTHGMPQIRRMIAFSEFARSGRKVGYKSHFEMLKFERRGFADVTPVAKEEDESRWNKASPLETLEILETAGDRQMMDDWTMQDESSTGIGAVAPFLKPWMVIGAYVGYRVEDETDWRVGLIRRIHRKDSGHPSIGLETYQEMPVCAQVRELKVMPGSAPAKEVLKEPSGDGPKDAIVLSQSKGLLMVPKGLFIQDRFLALSTGGSREAIRMMALVQSTGDCDCIRYEPVDD